MPSAGYPNAAAAGRRCAAPFHVVRNRVRGRGRSNRVDGPRADPIHVLRIPAGSSCVERPCSTETAHGPSNHHPNCPSPLMPPTAIAADWPEPPHSRHRHPDEPDDATPPDGAPRIPRAPLLAVVIQTVPTPTRHETAGQHSTFPSRQPPTGTAVRPVRNPRRPPPLPAPLPPPLPATTWAGPPPSVPLPPSRPTLAVPFDP